MSNSDWIVSMRLRARATALRAAALGVVVMTATSACSRPGLQRFGYGLGQQYRCTEAATRRPDEAPVNSSA